jgi:hypothetical protein
MGTLMKWVIPGAMSLGALLAAGPPAPHKYMAPVIVMVNPYVNGQVVTSLRNSQNSPILGTVNAISMNRCDVEIKRLSDNTYWTGTTWSPTVQNFTMTVSNRNPSPPWYDFRYDAGPASSNMTPGVQYLVWVYCADLSGGTTIQTITVTKA